MNNTPSVALAVLIIGAVAFVLYKPTADSLPTADEPVYLSAEADLSYNDFLDDLEKDCPYYEPNGFRYRECLADLLATRDKEASEYLGHFISDLQANTDPEFLTARQTFIVDLTRLSSTWRTYRDQICTVQADLYWGGSDQGGELNRCRLYETERFHRLVQNLRSEWVRQ